MSSFIRLHRVLTILALLGMLLSASAAQADQRTFPMAALRGKLVMTAYPDVTIDGKPVRMSPGSRIWGSDNLLRLPASLGDQKYIVNYTIDPYGQLNRVWLLTPDEAHADLSTQLSNIRQ